MKTTYVLILCLALLATSAVKASIFVHASQVNGITEFSISGSVNPLALTVRGGPFIGAATGTPAISPGVPQLGFGGNGHLGLNSTVYNLPNLQGPSAFGVSHSSFNPDQHTGTNFINFAFGGFYSLSVDQYTAQGATLNDTLAFSDITYVQLGLTPGVYHWSWSNGNATDSLTLQIDPIPEPTIVALATLSGIAAFAFARRQKRP